MPSAGGINAQFAVGHDALPIGGPVLPSAVRSATNSSVDIGNLGATGLLVFCNVSVVPGGDTLTFTVEGKDPVSGTYYTIVATVASAATGLKVLRIHPSIIPVANERVNDLVPEVWRVTVTHSGAGAFTYSVGAVPTPG